MSLQARTYLVNHEHAIFRSDSQRQDLLDPEKTRTELVALLLELLHRGFIVLFTAIRSDHHDDSSLGLHSHANGYAADVWPLASTRPDDYVDANDVRFRDFIDAASKSPWTYQIGLAGTADTSVNRAAGGDVVFEDSGADHVHLGAK